MQLNKFIFTQTSEGSSLWLMPYSGINHALQCAASRRPMFAGIVDTNSSIEEKPVVLERRSGFA